MQSLARSTGYTSGSPGLLPNSIHYVLRGSPTSLDKQGEMPESALAEQMLNGVSNF
jgi:hypothetical protein